MMNWSSSDFPSLSPPTPPGLDSQVMSPNADPDAYQEAGAVYTVKASAPAPPSPAPAGGQADDIRFPWEIDEAGAAAAAKSRLTLRQLDTGRAEDYDSWRHAAGAEVVAHTADPGRAVGFMAAIDQPALYPADALHAAVQKDGCLRTLDAQLYGAILGCLAGPMRAAVEGRIRAQGRPYSGCLALRLLDEWFHNNARKRRAVATRELIMLAPRGRGAAGMEGEGGVAEA